jgi:hypothetical protein
LASNEDITSCFSLPLSLEEFQELQEVIQLVETTNIDGYALDQRVLVLGAKYTPSNY